jgi:hypothetical protein
VNILQKIRQWIGKKPVAPLHEDGWKSWAEQRNFDVQVEAQGFCVLGHTEDVRWKLSWGPAQRTYIKCGELRISAELSLAPELQAVVMNRKLQETLEAAAFDPQACDPEGRFDMQTPPEARWLVAYDPLRGPELRGLQGRWSGVSNVKLWLERWLSGALGEALAQLQCPPDQPTTLTVEKGACTLRVALQEPSTAAATPWLALFECGVREARRAGRAGCATDDHEATQPGLFIPSLSTDREHVTLL